MKKVLLGLVVAVLAGCSSSETSTTTSPPQIPVTNPPITANADVAVTQQVALKIPDMHCPFNCWPNVQQTLAAEPGVGTLELAPQQKDDAIDNPVVYVGVGSDFNLEHAQAALAKVGFKNATTVEQ